MTKSVGNSWNSTATREYSLHVRKAMIKSMMKPVHPIQINFFAITDFLELGEEKFLTKQNLDLFGTLNLILDYDFTVVQSSPQMHWPGVRIEQSQSSR